MDGWWIYLIINSVGLVVAALIVGRKYIFNIRHYAAVFLGVMYITYVIRPFLSYQFGDGMAFLDLYLPGTNQQVVHDIYKLSAAFSGSIVAFAIGYRLLDRPSISSKNQQQPVERSDYSYTIFSIFLMVFGYASFFISRSGFFMRGVGVEYTRYAGGVVYANTTGYIEYAHYLIVAGAILYFASTGNLGSTLLLSSPWVANQIYYGYARFMYLNLAIGIASVWLLISSSKEKSKIRFKNILIILIPTLALLLLVTMRANRMFFQNSKNNKGISDLVQRTYSQHIDQVLGDFSGFEGTWFVVHYANNTDHLYGAGIFYNYFILPIPRLLWNTKPLKAEFTWGVLLDSSNLWASKWRRGLTRVTDFIWYNTAVKGSIGYAIEEWDWAGIGLNFILTGLFFGWMEKRYVTSAQTPVTVATYAATYGLISMQGRNSLFDYLLIYMLIFYIPYGVIGKILRKVYIQRK